MLDVYPVSLRAKPESTYCMYPNGWVRVECKHAEVVWFPIRCRKCTNCLKARVKRLVASVMDGLDGATLPSLLTLTSKPSATWPMIMAAWSKMWRRLKRRNPLLEYAVVKELGPRQGMLHLKNWTFVPWQTLRSWWEGYTGAFIVDIRRMESTDEVAAYVAKYVGKDVRDQAARKVITFSKGWRHTKRFKIPGPLKAERVPWFGKDTGAMAMLGINALICEWKR